MAGYQNFIGINAKLGPPRGGLERFGSKENVGF